MLYVIESGNDHPVVLECSMEGAQRLAASAFQGAFSCHPANVDRARAGFHYTVSPDGCHWELRVPEQN